MSKITLKINIACSNKLTKEFHTLVTIFDVCRQIRDEFPDSVEPGESVNDYGLLKIDELEPRFGTWLELRRTLEFYQLENNTILDYRTKKRPLRVETLDMTILTIIVDDSLNVRDLVKTVCARYGLNNPEEFSFIVKDEEGKFTKKRSSVRNAKKMAQMKKNLHTDDELKWLSSDKSLRDQGVDEKEVVVLRKRYYFTDKNVDGNDPVQLGLLYVQSQKDIVEGTHPCTKDEAVKFASLQQQIVSGDFNEEKHKPPIIIKVLPNILPKEYAKTRRIERLVSQEWKHYYGLKEMDAKFRFIQLCRALKTYGVTFFLVKEKKKARNRLVPRLLGITRDSIMRVDEITKDVMTTWPLTTAKRWAASPNSFTLDFGDYDSFYSVQTSEGETISQLIAGYIDIILTKKQASEKFVHDTDEEATMFEDNIAPQRATPMQHIDQAKMDIEVTGISRESRYLSPYYFNMANTKTYNEVDCKEQLLYIEIEKGEYGGYRQGLLADNLNEVAIDFYICDKCNGLLRNACIVGADQNLACEMCVLEGETSLPMIKSRKKIPEIGAKCPLVSRGCVWKGIIGEIDVHLDECTELIVNCPNKCKFILKRSELTNHCESECLNRRVNCMHCKAVLLYKELDNHLTVCPELPLLCLNECMKTFLRKEMSSHIEKDCPHTIVHCTNECGLKMKLTELSIQNEAN